MAANSTVDIVFRALGVAQVTAAVNGIRGQVAGIRGAFDSLNSSLAGLGLGGGLFALVSGARAALRAAEESRVAQFQLAQALRASGQDSEQNVTALTEQANALQHLTGVSDETIMASQKVLLTMGATAEEAYRLTPLILDIAAGGTEATTVARQLGAALDGDTITIGKLNIQAKNLDDLTRQLTDRFGGQAQALRDAKGEVAALSTVWSELTEKAGGALAAAANPQFEALSKYLSLVDGQLQRFELSLNGIAAFAGKYLAPTTLFFGSLSKLYNSFGFGSKAPANKPTASPSSSVKEMTEKEYDAKRKLIDIQIEEQRLAQATDNEKLRNSPKLLAKNLEFFRMEYRLLETRRELANNAPSTIEDAKIRQDQLATSQRMLEIEQKRRELQDAPAGSLFAGQQDRFAQFQLANEYDSRQSPGSVVTAGLQDTLASLGTTAHQVAGVIKETIGTAIQSISAGITGLIMGTLTWGQAIAQVGRQILTSLVQGIVQFFVTWITQRLLAALVGASIAVSEAASLSEIWAGPAILASIATEGQAAASGTAAVSLALSAAPAIAGQAASGFFVGGYTGDGPSTQVAGVVHRREMVFSAPAVAAIGRTNLEAMHAAALSGNSAGAADSTPTRIVIVDDRQRVDALLRDSRFRNAVVDLASR